MLWGWVWLNGDFGVLPSPIGSCLFHCIYFVFFFSQALSALFIIDNSKSHPFLAWLHYPVGATEILRSLKNWNGVTYINGIICIADTGNERLAYKAVVPSVFLDPKKMKMDDLRIQLQERDIWWKHWASGCKWKERKSNILPPMSITCPWIEKLITHLQ